MFEYETHSVTHHLAQYCGVMDDITCQAPLACLLQGRKIVVGRETLEFTKDRHPLFVGHVLIGWSECTETGVVFSRILMGMKNILHPTTHV